MGTVVELPALWGLFNLIAEDATPRECANEPCNNLFARQVGRAGPAGQHRTKGVMFCSRRARERKRSENVDAATERGRGNERKHG